MQPIYGLELAFRMLLLWQKKGALSGMSGGVIVQTGGQAMEVVASWVNLKRRPILESEGFSLLVGEETRK